MAIKTTENTESYSYVSRDEFRRIRDFVSNKRDNLILSILRELGITISELVDLRVSQIDLAGQKLFLKDRTIPFSNKILKDIRAYIESYSPTEFLFFTRQSSKITPRRVQQLLKSVSAHIKKDITPSILRKQAVSELLKKNVPVETVKELSGLKSLDKKRFLSETAFQKFYSSIQDKRDKVIVKLFYETGITVSELSNLRKKEFDFERRKITIHNDKRFASGELRICRLSKELSSKLREIINSKEPYQSQSPFIFTSRQSTRLTGRRIQQILKFYSEKSGQDIEVTPNVLRNSYIAQKIALEGISKAREDLKLNEFRFYEYGQLSFASTGRASFYRENSRTRTFDKSKRREHENKR
ncbi:MAG: tyrosine-type recombinase/integrase [Candidatus Woesearchaeota archaeon]